MKNEIMDKIKKVEVKLAKGEHLEREDHVFLFALSLIKGKSSSNTTTTEEKK